MRTIVVAILSILAVAAQAQTPPTEKELADAKHVCDVQYLTLPHHGDTMRDPYVAGKAGENCEKVRKAYIAAWEAKARSVPSSAIEDLVNRLPK